MGRRGGKRGGGEGGGFEDQYGEAMLSQDRGERNHGPGKTGGFSGGGEAGGAGKGPALKVASHVPAFLRQHAHLLHGKSRQEADPVIDRADDDNDSDFERDDGGALARAIAENPALAAQDTSLQRRADKAQADEEKAAGNRAFGDKDFETALKHFSTCIRLDPENEVYHSNRSAALMALGRHRDALVDGKKVLQLRPSWAKGYARVGAAFFALEQYTEASEAYRKALDLEPDDVGLQNALVQAQVQESKAVEQRKHKFRSGASGPAKRAKVVDSSSNRKADSGAGKSKLGDGKGSSKGMLSFEEEEEDT